MKTSLTILAAAAISMSAGASAAQSWNGYYAGINATMADLSLDYIYGPGPTFTVDDSGFGIFVGYNYQINPSFLVGAEASYNVSGIGVYNGPPITLDSTMSLRGRVGYILNTVMLYAAVGAEFGTFSYTYGGPPNENSTGISYGVGLEYMLSDHTNLRAEYVMSNFEEPYAPIVSSYDATISEIRIGLSYHF